MLDISYAEVSEEAIEYLCQWVESQKELKELYLANSYLGSRLACVGSKQSIA